MSTETKVAVDGKFLTFALGNEEYGFEILKVREIFGYTKITPIPKTPPYIKGVINLRGQVIPVIDLRTRFGMSEVEITEQTCIIVVETEHQGKTIGTGVIVDRVSEVQNIDAENIEPSPEFGSKIETEYIHGIGKVDESIKILLNIDVILDAKELSAIA